MTHWTHVKLKLLLSIWQKNCLLYYLALYVDYYINKELHMGTFGPTRDWDGESLQKGRTKSFAEDLTSHCELEERKRKDLSLGILMFIGVNFQEFT